MATLGLDCDMSLTPPKRGGRPKGSATKSVQQPEQRSVRDLVGHNDYYRAEDFEVEGEFDDKIRWIDTLDPDGLKEWVLDFYSQYLGDPLRTLRKDADILVLANFGLTWKSKEYGDHRYYRCTLIHARDHYWVLDQERIELLSVPMCVNHYVAMAYVVGRLEARKSKKLKIRMSTVLQDEANKIKY